MTPNPRADVPIRLAEDVFQVDSVVVLGAPRPQVRLIIDTPESDVEMTMDPGTALWLARQLWEASGLPFDHGLRFGRKDPS